MSIFSLFSPRIAAESFAMLFICQVYAARLVHIFCVCSSCRVHNSLINIKLVRCVTEPHCQYYSFRIFPFPHNMLVFVCLTERIDVAMLYTFRHNFSVGIHAHRETLTGDQTPLQTSARVYTHKRTHARAPCTRLYCVFCMLYAVQNTAMIAAAMSV